MHSKSPFPSLCVEKQRAGEDYHGEHCKALNVSLIAGKSHLVLEETTYTVVINLFS
jgi:hypothetical protein